MIEQQLKFEQLSAVIWNPDNVYNTGSWLQSILHNLSELGNYLKFFSAVAFVARSPNYFIPMMKLRVRKNEPDV